MTYILLSALVVLTGVAYITGKRNILSPWVIVCAVFSVSALFALINERLWDFTLSPQTVIVILAGVISFGAGETLVTYYFEKKQNKAITSTNGDQVTQEEMTDSRMYESSATRPAAVANSEISVPFYKLFAVCILMMAMLAYYFYKTYQLSIIGGNTGGIRSMLSFARLAMLSSNSMGRVYGYISIVTEAIAFIFGYIFLYNVIFFKFNIARLKFLVPVFLYFPFILLSTGRADFIYYIAGFVIIGSVFYQKKTNWNPGNTIKFILVGAASLTSFYIIFLLAGLLTGKSQQYELFQLISFYTGVSIPCLNNYLLHPPAVTSYIGDHSLYAVYSFLRSIGFDSVPELPQRHLEFVYFNEMAGNVYTAFRRLIQDYSFTGMLIIEFLIGMFYSVFFNNIRSGARKGLYIIIYGFIFYPIVMISIDDLFLASLISLNTVYSMICLGILYVIFIGRPKKILKSILKLKLKSSTNGL